MNTIISIIICLTVALSLPFVAANPTRGQACYNYVLIDARGTGEVQSTSLGFVKMIEMVMSSLPGGSKHDVIYPAAPDPSQLSTLIGVEDIKRFIQDGLRNCPKQKYALLGYSQGATVTNQVLQQYFTTSREGQAIKGIVTIGNPYHKPYRQGNVDENGGSSTAGAAGALLGFGLSMPDAWYTTGKVLDICFTDDQVCNGYSYENLFSPSHLYYPFSESVQNLGSRFLISKLS